MEDRLILVDCDEVLADLTPQFCKWHNYEFGTSFTKEMAFSHAYEESFGIPLSVVEQFFNLISSGAVSLPPFEGAKKFVQDLRNYGDVAACTATASAAWTGARALWLEEHAGIPAKDQIICGRKHKKRIGGDLLIDDYHNNCDEFYSRIGAPFILFDQPWNRGYDSRYGFRAKTYDDVVAVTKSLF